MTNMGEAVEAEELIEVTSVTDVRIGVFERRTATKTAGRATAVIEITVHADRADECSPITYFVRFSVNPGTGWSTPRRTDAKPKNRGAAQREADRQWALMLGWLRNVTPVPPRRAAGAVEECSCHE